MPGDEESVKQAKALALPTRSAILAHLLKTGSATAREVADEFDLHPNVARAHLDLLADAGFLTTAIKRQARGRPAKSYSTWEGEMGVVDDWEVSPREGEAPDIEMLESEAPRAAQPNPFRLISAILIQLVERMDPDTTYPLAEKVAREEGRKLMLDYRKGELDFPAAVRAMVEEFQRYSSDLKVVTIEPDYAEIETADCAFKAIALEHSDLVLVMDPALNEGAMAALGHPSDVEVEESVARGDSVCRMTITRKPQKRSKSKKKRP